MEQTNCVLVALPSWLQGEHKKDLLLNDKLTKDYQDSSFQNLSFKVQTQILRNANRIVDFAVLKQPMTDHCGFCFGALPHDHDRNKYLPITDRKVFEGIFTRAYNRLINEYTADLQKVVFWYAVEFFMQKGGTMGTPFSANQIADFLQDMPIWFWEN
jgi:hypothetical protein